MHFYFFEEKTLLQPTSLYKEKTKVKLYGKSAGNAYFCKKIGSVC
jgi:hypothetical protein